MVVNFLFYKFDNFSGNCFPSINIKDPDLWRLLKNNDKVIKIKKKDVEYFDISETLKQMNLKSNDFELDSIDFKYDKQLLTLLDINSKKYLTLCSDEVKKIKIKHYCPLVKLVYTVRKNYDLDFFIDRKNKIEIGNKNLISLIDKLPRIIPIEEVDEKLDQFFYDDYYGDFKNILNYNQNNSDFIYVSF